MNKAVEEAVVGAAKQIEKQLDDELDRLNNMQEDDLEVIRRNRIAQMKKEAEDRAIWRRNGHGTLQPISEKDFFARAKTSERMVAIFHRQGSSRYADDLIEHMTRIAERHVETLFTAIDAEKAMFLCTKLNIRILPSLVFVKNAEIEKVMLGLDQISPSGKFSTTGIEKRLFDFEVVSNTCIGDDE